MTIDEAIKHCEEIAEEKEGEAQDLAYSKLDWRYEANQCSECAKKNRQLVTWLKELKELRRKDAQIKDAINRCKMQKLAQDEISSFEYKVLKIYGVME